MIEKRFWRYPQNLWTTLWANGRRAPQSVDSPRGQRRCPFSRHRIDLNKINNLALIRANPNGHDRRLECIAVQQDFWG
jgi:hypothetical protein